MDHLFGNAVEWLIPVHYARDTQRLEVLLILAGCHSYHFETGLDR